jgi:hypothetical protein
VTSEVSSNYLIFLIAFSATTSTGFGIGWKSSFGP